MRVVVFTKVIALHSVDLLVSLLCSHHALLYQTVNVKEWSAVFSQLLQFINKITQIPSSTSTSRRDAPLPAGMMILGVYSSPVVVATRPLRLMRVDWEYGTCLRFSSGFYL